MDLVDLCNYIPNAQEVMSFLNSGFTTSLVGALFGAWAGAAAAQRISERIKDKEQHIGQIRGTNAAIMSAFTICNTILLLKKQYIRDLYQKFQWQEKELEQHQAGLAAETIPAGTPFSFQADLRSLQMPLVPIDVLKSQVYEKISINGRPLAAVSSLMGAIETLSACINRRNQLIESFKNLSSAEKEALPALYFGFPYDSGHVSTEYADTLEIIYKNTDDAIFFAHLLCKDLEDYGNEILRNYNCKYNKTKLRINSADFALAREGGLLPSNEDYQDWLKGFQTRKSDEKAKSK